MRGTKWGARWSLSEKGWLLRSQLPCLGLFTSLCHCLSCLSAGCQGPSHSAAGSQPCWAFRGRLLKVRHVFRAELTVVFAFPLRGAGCPQEEQQTLAAHLLPEPGCIVAPGETPGPAVPCPRGWPYQGVNLCAGFLPTPQCTCLQ